MSIDIKDLQAPGTRGAGSVGGKAGAPVTARTTTGGVGQGKAGGAAGDSVSLTQAGMQLAQMEQKLAGQPVVDTQRVQQLRQKLESGGYQIDPARVADKLLRLESSFKP